MGAVSLPGRALAIFAVALLAIIHQDPSANSTSLQEPPENHVREPSSTGQQTLWMDPGDVASLDFEYGPGGKDRQPVSPFQFVDEDMAGTTAKINVIDARGVSWNIKWGREVFPSTFCTRLAWACGYVAAPEYFVAYGYIAGARDLRRARAYVAPDGWFENARFQLRAKSPRFLKDQGWEWAENPFVGTRELAGLKILTMLVSNVDAKDANLGVFEEDGDGKRYLFAVIDWGSSMGKWGIPLLRNVGECEGFAKQSRDFVSNRKGRLRWQFRGKHDRELMDGIDVADARWLLQYLGEITEKQFRSGLLASGATLREADCYTPALLERVRQLRQAANAGNARTK
ncbi:MAG TPA: hypothetical protein VFY29_01885 [Terriglobia bacterium]|nr:hypothetical protein [Terriglobia bacterium]